MDINLLLQAPNQPVWRPLPHKANQPGATSRVRPFFIGRVMEKQQFQ